MIDFGNNFVIGFGVDFDTEIGIDFGTIIRVEFDTDTTRALAWSSVHLFQLDCRFLLLFLVLHGCSFCSSGPSPDPFWYGFGLTIGSLVSFL